LGKVSSCPTRFHVCEGSVHAMKNRSALISSISLLIITLLALALRLYRLDAQSLWYDEGFSVFLARMNLADITARTAADIQPPFYYYLLHIWTGLFGEGEKTLRALSLLFGVLTVPLAYAVAWQLFSNRLAGLLAALLVAVSPLHLWYSQEVRMYSLLTFLGLLSSYLLLLIVRRVLPSAPRGGERLKSHLRGPKWDLVLWVAYALTSIAAMYTHYFAFFILAFQGVYLLLIWTARGFGLSRLIMGGVASGIGILLAYLPWLPSMFLRYGADASYWPGQLKLPEVLQDTAVSWVGGESISRTVGLLLAIGYGAILVVCLLTLLRDARRPSPVAERTARATERRAPGTGAAAPEAAQIIPPSPFPNTQYPISFLLLYLLLPPALILLLSYDAPKFNARYMMVSHPALLLILSGGLAGLWKWRKGIVATLFRRVLATLALTFLVGVSAYADYQAYSAPTFARADFRGAARYIRKHIASDETVILCSGHMFPVFDIYAPGVERHLLPDSPTLDTTRTLDYSVAADLNRWLAGEGGVWVVLWQDEVVDPAGYLTTMLGEVGTEQPMKRGFAQIRLRHYRLPAVVGFADRPAIAHPTDLNFGSKLRLLGYSQSGQQQATLYWEALRPLDQDYRVSIALRDTNGQVWGQWDGRPTAYGYPTDRWRAGQIVPGRYELVPLPGTPPGDYGLDVGVYTEDDPTGLDVLDPAGAPQGKRAMLGAVTLAVPAATLDAMETPNQIQAEMGGGLSLAGWGLSRTEAQPGDRLLLTLIWSVNSQPQGDYRARVLVTDAMSQTLDAGIFPLTNAWHPTHIWLPGQAWRGQNSFRLPIQAQPGVAQLAVQLLDAAGEPLGPTVAFTALQVLPTTRLFIAPRPQTVRESDFDGKITLLGADMSKGSLQRGETLAITLYWQAQQEMDIPYTVFVHLVGPDGQVVSGNDGQPVRGGRPTTGWVPGEFVADPHDLPVSSDLAPGYYVIEVGLYDAGAPGMPRLPILGEEGEAATDRVIFGPVQVSK